ncbi:MAG: insulinase family protein [Micromonosporaceae bacterium]
MQQIEVDGVPALLAPTTGPMMAGLTFRVGRADETLATTGITHLVEHLALFRSNLSDYHMNGSTGPTVTHFLMRGSETDITDFLGSVCASLSDLPLERLETEKEILRTEESGRSNGVNSAMPLWRYGARGYGLVSYPEWGLSRLTAEDVRQWAASWFTRQNAVLWIAGDRVPPGLRLRLPDGARRPLPQPTSALPSTPAYFADGRGGVVFDTVLPRCATTRLFAGVLERELFRSLRQEGGYSYTATTEYFPRDADHAVVTAFADALPEKQDAVVGGFVDVLAKLRAGRIEQSDLDAVRGHAGVELREPNLEAASLPAAAMDLLTGRPRPSREELERELHETTAGEVHAVARQAVEAGLLRVPDGHTADWAGYTAAPTSSPAAVDGTRYRSLEDPDTTLVVGPDGVSLGYGSGQLTVRYAECAAMLAWPDGARQLTATDAISLRIEPTLYAVEPAAIAAIDAAVPSARVVPRPARDPENIPHPEPKQVASRPKPGGLHMVGMIVLFIVGSAGCCFSGLLSWVTVSPPVGEESDVDVEWYTGLTVLWLITLAFLVPATVMLVRRLRSKA